MDNYIDNTGGYLAGWLEQILENAIKCRASDIHFEPGRDNYSIRYRVDGILQSIDFFPKGLQEKYTSRIKVLAKMDIMEHRFPQDGHFEFKFNNRTYNIRVSSLPTVYGEAIVLRILDREDTLHNLKLLGFNQDQLLLMDALIKRSSGVVLSTGPSGAGKTTLLYSVIKKLSNHETNIISIEDPIELQMANIRQTQINDASGLTFAKIMQSIVRQDPDIVMLGEIRDNETAEMVINAALTGVFVLSTMHTFTFPALITRLTEMGVSDSIVAQTLKGVISTRLIRKICDKCAVEYQLTESEKQYLGESNQPAVHRKGKGCEECRNTGYLGRTGIFEVVYLDHDIRSHIVQKKSYSEMNKMLKEKKVNNLKDSAVEKINQGVTTFEEVVRVIGLMPFITGAV